MISPRHANVFVVLLLVSIDLVVTSVFFFHFQWFQRSSCHFIDFHFAVVNYLIWFWFLWYIFVFQCYVLYMCVKSTRNYYILYKDFCFYPNSPTMVSMLETVHHPHFPVSFCDNINYTWLDLILLHNWQHWWMSNRYTETKMNVELVMLEPTPNTMILSRYTKLQ